MERRVDTRQMSWGRACHNAKRPESHGYQTIENAKYDTEDIFHQPPLLATAKQHAKSLSKPLCNNTLATTHKTLASLCQGWTSEKVNSVKHW